MGKIVTVAKSETAIGLSYRRSVSRVFLDPQIHRQIVVCIPRVLPGISPPSWQVYLVAPFLGYSSHADGISARTHRSNRTIIKARDHGCVMRSHLSLN